ncbi:stachyose synthase-like [Rhodamnia argentea]|uniref:galactinol--sucrose galactosyltransferase n=1 Tax=Rhodamnia argentea TaxID=178133 RepID=A0A8B8QT60_9MYRT|nr:stachyose synthase-like [Rhodamnia argentea]XP_030549492.1 stachyose synthase-like [Rhodamnia argentea]XP_048137245.1 stachyose synthase-like [Rhodamnia argentea]
MAPPNDPAKPLANVLRAKAQQNHFDLSEGKLSVNGVNILSEVPSNVSLTHFSSTRRSSDAPLPLLLRVDSTASRGCFLGFAHDEPSDRLVNSLGKFSDREFLSIFRFKTWWSTMWVGSSGSDLQMETQWVLLNVPEASSYVVIVPIVEGAFRSALHPGRGGHVTICAESGSTRATASSFEAIAYVHVSDNPYNVMKEAYGAIRVHLNTFKLLEEKTVPPLVDKFGWCTWDAFYLTVNPTGVWHGVREFAEGGVSPRFLIIDDGWQSINHDGQDPNEDAKNLVLGGTQMTARLHRLDECEKFRKYRAGTMLGPGAPSFDPKKPKMLIAKAIEVEHAEKDRDKAVQSGVKDLAELELKIEKLKRELDQLFGGEESGEDYGAGGCRKCAGKSENYGFKAFTTDLREKFKGLDDIYVWHALCGAWGGVRPGSTHLKSKVVPTKLSPGLDGTMTDLAVVKIVEGGIGLVDPSQAGDFYDSMHSYLASVGITGVKVDVIHTLEYVSEEYGGRVELAKAYYKGISDSLAKNFKGSGLISSMQQCNDFFFLGTRQISIGRVGDDFWFQDPNGDPMGVYWLQGVHMIHCAYNSMWMGQIIQPDWDMFQSDHLCAKFHAGSRAICGGPVYVSDSVGGHDFRLIKQLVFPDGTIPKCQHFALPTRDCLFRNPLFDSETILKIWNFNKYGGVIGAFNCQGAGWDPKEQRIRGHSECYKPMSGSVQTTDIEWDQTKGSTQMGTAPEFAVYLGQADELILTTPRSGPISITIQPSCFEIFSFVPIMHLGPNSTKFAPIGLTSMFNCGGTIQDLEYHDFGANVKVKGGGVFLAYSSGAPKKCTVNGVGAVFGWSSEDGKLTVDLPWVEELGGVSTVDLVF